MAIPAGGDDPPRDADEAQAIGGLTFVDRLDVTVVNITAHVTDKRGQPVSDLTIDDFKITQDGQEQEISNFRLYTEEVYRNHFNAQELPGLEAPPPTAGDDLPVEDLRPVYLVLYVDNDNLHPIDRNRVLTQARQFVRNNLRPPVQMMVVSYQKFISILQPFTSDQGEVLDALRELRKASGNFAAREKERRELVDKMQVTHQDEGDRAGTGGFNWEKSDFYQRILGFAEEEANDLQFSIDALRSTINSISGLEGKKGLVYISNGLPMVPGLDLFTIYDELFGSEAMTTQINRGDRTALFTSLVSAANAQDITFYTIGAAGLQLIQMGGAKYAAPIDTGTASLGAKNYTDSLRYIAQDTGGVAYVDVNEFGPVFESIARDLFSYYSLGYHLKLSGSDKVHRIKITIPDHPGYTVRYRRRMVEKSTSTEVLEKVLTGLVFDLDENPLDLGFEPGLPQPTGTNRSVVPFELSFPLRNIALLPDGDDYVGHITYVIAARDGDGKQSDVVQKEKELRIPSADYEIAQRKRLGATVHLLMNPGRHRVVAGLLDDVTRQSSYFITNVTVAESP